MKMELESVHETRSLAPEIYVHGLTMYECCQTLGPAAGWQFCEGPQSRLVGQRVSENRVQLTANANIQ
jgi:hypothetical protein